MSNPRKKKNVPTNRVALAQLSINVAQNWTTEFPTLSVPRTNPRDLNAQGQHLTQLLTSDQLNASNRKGNALAVRAHNKMLNGAVSVLKKRIQGEFIQQKNWDNEYLAYGLVKIGRSYQLPTDNTKRVPALQMLVTKLSEAGNPLANRSQMGLAEWTAWQQTHLQLWQSSNQLRQEKTALLIDIRSTVKEVKGALGRISKSIDINYDSTEAKSRKRTMGFLKESL